MLKFKEMHMIGLHEIVCLCFMYFHMNIMFDPFIIIDTANDYTR